MTTPIERILDRLEKVKATGDGEWMACCPVTSHNDRTPSLSIKETEGRVLLNDFGGCPNEEIVAAMGLGMSDLFPTKEHQARRVIAETDYRVRDTASEVHGVHCRRDYSDGSKDVFWVQPDGTKGLGGRKLDTMPLYGSEHLAARPDEPVIVCEGEKAAQALLDAGYLAVGTVTGSGGAPNAEVLAVLTGRDVLLWPDHDVPGMTHMMRIARTLGAMKGA